MLFWASYHYHKGLKIMAAIGFTSGARDKKKKKTRQGRGSFTKYGKPGPFGGNKTYKKKSRGQGR